MQYTRVGDVDLPELPPGWHVAVDTEGSGLHVDGDPVPSSSKPAAPAARISAVSVSFRAPREDENGELEEGDEILDFAWPFDQGPVIGKPGRPIKDPETGLVTFEVLTEADVDKLLDSFEKYYGRPVSYEEACPNLPASEYAKLIGWLDRRDNVTFHNSVHDMHQFRAGLRAGAGGDSNVEDGDFAWDLDSLVGEWRDWKRQTPDDLDWMEPSPKVLPEGVRRRRVHCSMVCQKQLIDPLLPAALKPTAMRLWGMDEGEEAEELKNELGRMKAIAPAMHKRYDLLPWCGAVGIYAAKDTNLAFRLREYQEAAEEEGAVLPRFRELLQGEMELRTTLYRMERRGVAYDADASAAQGAKLRQQAKELASGMPFDPSKPNSAKRYYFGPVCSVATQRSEGTIMTLDLQAADAMTSGLTFCEKSCGECEGKNGLGLQPSNRTPTGLPQLDIVEVERLEQEGLPWAREYLTYTKLRNSDSKWYTGWAARTGPDGRIRTQYKQCQQDADRPGSAKGGTKSGRLAVGFWQCQAIPHGNLIPEGAEPVRGYIGAEEDYELYEHDLATGEMRVVTVIANSTKLWDAIDAGADLHAMNARAFFKDKGEPGHPKFAQFRNAAKRGTFGLLYGGGPYGLKEQIEAAAHEKISLNDVKEAIQSFFDTYPEFRTLTDQATYKVTRWMGGPGYLTMLDGWRRWYALTEKTNSAVNQVIQGNLARAMNQWMCAVEREVPGVLLLQIHDSLVTRHRKTPEGRAEAQRVSDVGERVFQKYFDVRGRVMTWGIEPDLWKAAK